MDKIAMEKLAYSGYAKFEEYYTHIWEMFNRYGTCVLDKDLEEDETAIRKILEKSKSLDVMKEALAEYWITNYLIVIKSFEDFDKAFDIIHNTDSFYLYREPRLFASISTEDICCISSELLEKIVEKADRVGVMYILGKKRFYKIECNDIGPSINVKFISDSKHVITVD